MTGVFLKSQLWAGDLLRWKFPEDLRPRKLGGMQRILGRWEGRGGFEVGGKMEQEPSSLPPSWAQEQVGRS